MPPSLNAPGVPAEEQSLLSSPPRVWAPTINRNAPGGSHGRKLVAYPWISWNLPRRGHQLLKVPLPGDHPATGKLPPAKGRGCTETLPAAVCQPRHLTRGEETFRALGPQLLSGQEHRWSITWELGPPRARKPPDL